MKCRWCAEAPVTPVAGEPFTEADLCDRCADEPDAIEFLAAYRAAYLQQKAGEG